jgi:NADPH:quinone reductase-like Zn-dependent oxidoreductase
VIAGGPLEIPLIKLSNLFSFKKTIPFFVKTDGRILEGLSNLIREGRVKPIIEKTYIWKDLAQAHRHVETGKIAGKIGVSLVSDLSKMGN